MLSERGVHAAASAISTILGGGGANTTSGERCYNFDKSKLTTTKQGGVIFNDNKLIDDNNLLNLNEDEERKRFQIELEFVQSLANPDYLNYLAQRGYFKNQTFINYFILIIKVIK